MRSRPFTSPLPGQNGLSTLISGHDYSRIGCPNDESVPLVDLDRETSRPLLTQQRPHRVRIQGRLATVRTVSVSNFKRTKSSNSILQPSIHCSYVRIPSKGHQDFFDSSEDEEDKFHDDFATEEDRQLRGYGIGGAGNIRRPTDIMGVSSRSPASTMRTKSSKLRLGMSRLLHNLREYRRGKGSVGVS